MTDTKKAYREKIWERREHAKLMNQWPSRGMAITTLNMESKKRADNLYMQKVSIKGKSPYQFHKSLGYGHGAPSIPLMNVIHFCEDKDVGLS